MLDLDLQPLKEELTLKRKGERWYVRDPIRRKFLLLTQEELVRQLVIAYLWKVKGYPLKRFAVEKQMEVFNLPKRYDILVFGPRVQPFLLVECKAPQVPISQDTFDQIARYNLPVKAPYYLLTNGHTSYCCSLEYEKGIYHVLNDLPPLPV